MTSTIQELIDRKSTRAFKDTEISLQDKETILLATINAPSAGNQQPYRIIDITNQEVLDKLAVLCDNQPFIKTAKMALVFCVDFKKWYDTFKHFDCNPRDMGLGDFVLSLEDATIAAQNAVTAAQSLSIGSCYIGDIMENKEKVCELLKLPRTVMPALFVVFGYPQDGVINRAKPKRESLKTIVCQNEYKELNKDELKEMFKEKQNLKTDEEFEEWIKAFANRKYNSDFSKEMKRSVCEYIKEYM